MSKPEKGSVWARIAAALVVLTVLYVASFGPAMWIMGGLLKSGLINEGGQVIFMLLYFPLFWAADQLPAINALLRFYAALI